MPKELCSLGIILNFHCIRSNVNYSTLFSFFNFVSPGVSAMQASQTHLAVPFANCLFNAIIIHYVIQYYHGRSNGAPLMDLAWTTTHHCKSTPLFIWNSWLWWTLGSLNLKHQCRHFLFQRKKPNLDFVVFDSRWPPRERLWRVERSWDRLWGVERSTLMIKTFILSSKKETLMVG